MICIRTYTQLDWTFDLSCQQVFKVHISWPDADDLLSNGLEFDNEVEGPWPLGRRACLQVRLGIGEPLKGKVRLKEKVGFVFLCFKLGKCDLSKPCNQGPQGSIVVDAEVVESR